MRQERDLQSVSMPTGEHGVVLPTTRSHDPFAPKCILTGEQAAALDAHIATLPPFVQRRIQGDPTLLKQIAAEQGFIYTTGE